MSRYDIKVHDTYFKVSLKEQRIAIDFLKTHLATEVVSQIDWRSLELTDKEYTVEKNRHLYSDIVYKAKINERLGYIFLLLEHQSSPDEMMAFRLLEYSLGIMRDHLRQGFAKLPIVLPLYLYHGKVSSYPHSTALEDCFEDKVLARNWMFRPFKLIDLTCIEDEEIARHGMASVMEILFKRVQHEDFYDVLLSKMLSEESFFRKILSRFTEDQFKNAIRYILHASKKNVEPVVIDEILEQLTHTFPNNTEQIMSLAESLEQRGIQKGRLEGIQEGIEKGIEKGAHEKAIEIAGQMLARNLSSDQIKWFTKLSDEELEALKF